LRPAVQKNERRKRRRESAVVGVVTSDGVYLPPRELNEQKGQGNILLQKRR